MRVGLVGCGAIAPVHLIALREQGQEVAALCDIDLEKAKNLQRQFSFQCEIYSDYEQMIGEGRIEAVHICTPHHLHAQMAISALKKGIHVLTEKPACIDLDELKRLKEAVEGSTAHYGVCFQNRYNESTKIVCEYLKENPALGGEGNVFWKREKDYYVHSGWRGKLKTEGGSALINQGIHTLDLLCCLVDEPIRVSAVTANLNHGDYNDTEDTVAAFYEGKRANFNFFVTTNATQDTPAKIRIFTKDGILEIAGERVTLNGNALANPQSCVCVGKRVWGDSHKELIGEFYESVSKNIPSGIDFAHTELIHRVVFATYECGGRVCAPRTIERSK